MSSVIPLKHAARMNTRVLPDGTPPATSFEYIDIGSVDSDGHICRPMAEITFADAPSRARRLATPGATIISTVRTYLRAIGFVDNTLSGRAVFSTGFAVLEPTEHLDPRFFYYSCRAETFVEEVVARSVGVSYPAIAPSELGSIAINVPELEDQRRVADFLDDQVARIDEVICLRDQQVLDMAARLASWEDAEVGKLTQKCRAVPLRWIVRVGSGEFLPSSDFIDEGSYAVVGGNGSAGRFNRFNAEPGTIAVGRVGALCGNVHLLSRRTWVTDNALVVRPMEMDSMFLALVLTAARLNSERSQTAQPLITGETVKRVLAPNASATEQRTLADLWRTQLETTNRARAETHAEISLLEERKRSLITAAVTGEFDVSTASGRGVA